MSRIMRHLPEEVESEGANEAAIATAADLKRKQCPPPSSKHVHLVVVKKYIRTEPQLEAAKQQHLDLIAS